MKMTAGDIKSYPKFHQYVRNALPTVITVPSIVYAFKKIGGIDKATLRGALQWGQGPAVKITILTGAVGEFTPGIGSSEVRIHKNIVDEFELGKGRRVAKAGYVYLVGVTLLHELIHWADDQDGTDYPGEEGWSFETQVYGSIIN